jgi:hypothetical protein
MPNLGKTFSGVFYRRTSASSGDAAPTKTYSLLRFYDDGVVLWTQFTDQSSLDAIWAQVNGWFNRESSDERVGKGNYKSDGTLVSLKVDNSITYGTLEYTGAYDGGSKMELIRDNKHFETYLALFPPSRAGAASNDPLDIQKQLDERRKRLLGGENKPSGEPETT